jgi:ATP-dependent Zn protease
VIVLSQPEGWEPSALETTSLRLGDGTLVQVGKSTEARQDLLARFRAALGLVTLSIVVVALAGRAAEMQEYGEASTGIASDLAAATTIAAQLIGLVGAGDSLLSLEAAEMHMAGNITAKVLSDDRSRVQADDIMNKAADKSACMLLEHRGALLAVADALCEHDELTGDLVHEIVAAAVSTSS